MRNTSGLKRGGQQGRKPGSKNKTPKGFKPLVREAIRQVIYEDPNLLPEAIRRGLTGRQSAAFVSLCAAYLDGKPTDHVEMDVTGRTVVQHVHEDVPPTPSAPTTEGSTGGER